MLSNNPKQDQFIVRIPSTFFQKEIVDKYDLLLKQYGMTFDKIEDVINESIQGLTLPEFSYTPIEQFAKRQQYSSSNEYFVSNENIQNILQKTVTLTFRHSDAYLTYFCLLEHFFSLYDFKNKKPSRHLGTWPIQIITAEGNVIYTFNLKRVLFTGISDLSLSYTNNDRSFITFDCTFYYSEFDTVFTLPELNLKN